jgi:S-adenosyl-L-methionine hydrolase (adenosine-forming)
MIFLFTDFGAADIYVGQVKAVLHAHAPRVPVIDLLHDAPAFNVKAGAHLLAALMTRVPSGAVTLAVVDPGVGGARKAVAIRADGRWLVGPDNGLLSVAAARARKREVYAVGWRPRELSASFHGRDLFAPVAGLLARGDRKTAKLRKTRLAVSFRAHDLGAVIYVDHFGNVVTGLRASALGRDRVLLVNGCQIPYARIYSEVPPAKLFWYENSLGLVELAANSESAQRMLGISLGDPLE